MDPAEVEFVSEGMQLEVIPSFRGARLFLISGELGPFEPGVALQAPAWLALALRRRRLCRLTPPAWLAPAALGELLEREKRERLFTEPPSPHYLELAKLLLDVAAEDVPNADEVRTMVKDIWDVRAAKLRTSVDALMKAGGNYGRLDHLTMMEINSAKPLLPLAMDHLYRLQKNTQMSLNNTVSNLSSSYMNSSSFSNI